MRLEKGLLLTEPRWLGKIRVVVPRLCLDTTLISFFVRVTPLVFFAKVLLLYALSAVFPTGDALLLTRLAKAGVVAEIPAEMMMMRRYWDVVVISDHMLQRAGQGAYRPN